MIQTSLQISTENWKHFSCIWQVSRLVTGFFNFLSTTQGHLRTTSVIYKQVLLCIFCNSSHTYMYERYANPFLCQIHRISPYTTTKQNTQYIWNSILNGHSPENWSKLWQRVKIQSVNFLMLLFGNESLTSLVFINIRHKLTGWQELG